mmetsp:Transcript_10215/g.16836  ORF Transcript_10215/g.16836 Transcript_10215/m.16836 type:complete len:274 (-) Transcript_10215:677-1498(-)
MLLLLGLCVRRDSFSIKTTFTIHGIGSIRARKLLVRVVTSRVVLIVILRATTSSSLVVGPGPFMGRKVGRVILILSVSIRMMIHHEVRLMMITSMVVIAWMLMVRLIPVVYVVKVPLIPSIPIVSIVLVGHADTLVLIIKLLHHHIFAAGGVVAIVGITACGGGGRGVVTSVVNLRFACFEFATLTEDVQYASFTWDVIKERVCHFLIGKSNKSKATAPLCMTIHHNNGINYFSKFFKEAEELFIIDSGRQPPHKQLAWIRLSGWCALPLPVS